jgi:hypothetical protein
MVELRRYNLTWDEFLIQKWFQDELVTGNRETSKEVSSSSHMAEGSTSSKKKEISSSHLQRITNYKRVINKERKMFLSLSTTDSRG